MLLCMLQDGKNHQYAVIRYLYNERERERSNSFETGSVSIVTPSPPAAFSHLPAKAFCHPRPKAASPGGTAFVGWSGFRRVVRLEEATELGWLTGLLA